MFENLKDFIPVLAIWGAILSTYLFVVGQIDRRKKANAENVVDIRFKYASISSNQLHYEREATSYEGKFYGFFPFHFILTNHSAFPIQIINASVTVWSTDKNEEPEQIHSAVPMGAVGVGCYSDTPSRNITIGSRASISLVPLDESAYIQAHHYLNDISSRILLLPRVDTATDSWFQGYGVLPHGVSGIYQGDNVAFIPVTKKLRSN